jgi:hypothetical protein
MQGFHFSKATLKYSEQVFTELRGSQKILTFLNPREKDDID